MGVFFNLFAFLLTISVILSIAMPGEETQFLKDNFFSNFLQPVTDPITGDVVYGTNTTQSLRPEWTGEVQQESGFFQRFLDGLSIVKRFVNTIINIATVPITITFRLNMPNVVRLLFFLPLTLLYIVSVFAVLIRGVNA